MDKPSVLATEYDAALRRYLDAHHDYVSLPQEDRDYAIDELVRAVHQLEGVHWEEAREDLDDVPPAYAELCLRAKFAFRRFRDRDPQTFSELEGALAAMATDPHHAVSPHPDFRNFTCRLRYARAAIRLAEAKGSGDARELAEATKEHRAAMNASFETMRSELHALDPGLAPLNIQPAKWLKPVTWSKDDPVG